MSEERREAIEKAWEAAEGTEGEALEEKKEVQAPGEASTEAVVEEKSSGAQEKAPDPYKEEKKVAATREEEKPTEQIQQTVPTDRAPVGWKPAQREKWAALPADVRMEITRREREIQEGMKQTETIRRFANEFAQIVNPYSHLIAQQGSTPLRAVQNLMSTAAALTTGDQEQKSRVVANIIGQYGIDLKTLDRVLSTVVKDGRVAPVAGPQVDTPPAWAKPMFEFMTTVQQRQQAAQEQSQASAQAAVAAMAEKPFFEDLREEMADIMEVAAKRGISMTLEQAYDRAVQMNDEIKGILSQRQAAAKARSPVSEAAATLARARKAASTVSGGPSGESSGVAKSSAKSRREAIEEAWERASGG